MARPRAGGGGEASRSDRREQEDEESETSQIILLHCSECYLFIYLFFDPDGRNVNVKRRFFSENSQSNAAECKSAV